MNRKNGRCTVLTVDLATLSKTTNTYHRKIVVWCAIGSEIQSLDLSFLKKPRAMQLLLMDNDIEQ